MKQNTFLLIASIICSAASYSQTLQPLDSYLKNDAISANAKALYRHDFTPSDEERTFGIIKGMFTKNDETRPFYLYLVSEMLVISDGALSESLGGDCKELLETNPDGLIQFLYYADAVPTVKYYNHWVNIVASEFYIDCEEHRRRCLNESKITTLSHCASKHKPLIVKMYDDIEAYLDKNK